MTIVKKVTMQRAILVVADDRALREVIKYTVAEERTILTCHKAWQNTAFFLDRPVSLLAATVAPDLSPCRTEVYHLIKQVTHAFIDAFKVKESIA
jgi:hypothetical protein